MIESLEPRRLFAAGFLDSSFGTNGSVLEKIGSTSNDATAGAVQSDGKILVVGDAVTKTSQVAYITRLNSDGSVDTSYGTNGVTTLEVLNTHTIATGISIDPTTGDAVICGVAGMGVTGQAFIAEYDTTGHLVTSFGTNGVTTFAPYGGSAAASDCLVLPDGLIYVSGTSISTYGIGIMYAQFTSDGIANTALGSAAVNVFEAQSGLAAIGTRIAQDGGLTLVAGFEVNLANGQMVMGVVGFNPDTSINTGFGQNGIAFPQFGNTNEVALGITVDPTTHDFYVAGATANGLVGLLPGLPSEGEAGHATSSSFAIASFNLDGTLNTDFNGTGLQTVSFPGISLAGASSIAEQSDGDLVIAGSGETGRATADIAAARLNPDGSLDTTFADGGTEEASPGTGSSGAFAVAINSVTNAIVLFGHAKLLSGDYLDVSQLTSDSSTETTNPGPTPALSPTVKATFPVAAVSGATAHGFSAAVAVTNSGTGAATGAATLTVYLSTTSTLDSSTATLAETVPLNLKLNPGKSINVPVKLKTFPTGLNGTYYLLSQISGAGTTTPATGASTATGVIAPAFFDLVNESATAAPLTVDIGKKLTILDTLENGGNVPDVGTLAVQLALSQTSDGANAVPVDVPLSAPLNLAPGKKKTVRLSLTVPTSATSGGYFLVLTIDPQNTFNETSLANNTVVDLKMETIG